MEDTVKQFGPIKKGKRAFESVAFAIKQSILNGDWKPGNRLPSENDLADQFCVSRHTIRQALRILELSGFLEIKTGVSGGPVVSDTIATVISNLYFDAFQMESISVEEFVSAWLAVEKAVLIEACQRIEKQHAEELKANIKAAKELIAAKKFPTVLNFEFHALLANMSQNRIYTIFAKGILSIMQSMRIHNPVDFNTSKSATLDHENILEALLQKNYDLASERMEAHLLRIGRSFMQKK